MTQHAEVKLSLFGEVGGRFKVLGKTKECPNSTEEIVVQALEDYGNDISENQTMTFMELMLEGDIPDGIPTLPYNEDWAPF